MADVTLAECHGQGWLVGGEEYIDDLLANTLAPSVTIEIVACADRAELLEMWHANTGEPIVGAMPWLIHPAIMRRVKGTLGEQCIRFTPWSAMLTDDAQALIVTAATWMGSNPAARLVLRQFCPADAPAGLADLQRLRVQLVIGALTRAGAEPGRLGEETEAPSDPTDADRLDIVGIAQAAVTTG